MLCSKDVLIYLCGIVNLSVIDAFTIFSALIMRHTNDNAAFTLSAYAIRGGKANLIDPAVATTRTLSTKTCSIRTYASGIRGVLRTAGTLI